MQKYIDYIREHLDDRTLLECLAEEAGELTQAALKLIRAEGLNNNYTPKSICDADANLTEEIGDILACVIALGIDIPDPYNNPKWKRWATRIKKSESDKISNEDRRPD